MKFQKARLNSKELIIVGLVITTLLLQCCSFILFRDNITFLGVIYELLNPYLLTILAATIFYHKSVHQLTLSVLVAGTLAGLLGLTGLLASNPYFGIGLGQNLEILSGTYWENLSLKEDSSLSNGRFKFSFADPNSMAMTFVYLTLSTHFLKRQYSTIRLLFFMLSVVVVFLSGSRTGMFVMGLAALYLIKFRYWPFATLFLLTLLPILEVDIFTRILERLSDVDGGGDLNGRSVRWRYHFNKLNYQYLAIGNGFTGDQTGPLKLAHNNFLALVYKGGVINLLSFLMLNLFLVLQSRRKFVIIVVATLLFSIGQELCVSRSPLYVYSYFFLIYMKYANSAVMHRFQQV